MVSHRKNHYHFDVNEYLIVKVVSLWRSEEVLFVTRKMLRERAVVLASQNGRAPHEVCKMDWEQAKNEMCGVRTSDTSPTAALQISDS